MRFIIFLWFTALSSSVYSQLYVRLDAGYDYALSPPKTERLLYADEVLYQDHVDSNFGGGVRTGLAFGYDINAQLSVDCSFSMRLFGKQKSEFVDFTNINPKYYGAYIGPIGHMQIKYDSWEISPTLTYTFGNAKWQPYIRLGLNILKAKYDFKGRFTGPDFSKFLQYKMGTYETHENGSGSWSFGFHSALGLKYHLSERYTISSGLGLVYNTYKFADQSVERKFNGEKVEVPNSYLYGSDKVDFNRISINVGLKYALL